MAMCPTCGCRRFDRYCAQCGNAIKQPVPRAPVIPVAAFAPPLPPPSRTGLKLTLFILLLVAAVALLAGVRSQTFAPPLMRSSLYAPEGDISQFDLENEIAARLSSGRQSIDRLNQKIAYLQSHPDRFGTAGTRPPYGKYRDPQYASSTLHSAVIQAEAILLRIKEVQRNVQVYAANQAGRAELSPSQSESDQSFRRNARASLWSWSRQLDAVIRQADMDAP